MRQISPTQASRQDNNNTANNWLTGITDNYRSYNSANSKFPTVAITRAGNVDPQKGFANFYGSGRYSLNAHFYANSSSTADGGNRISYLAPSGSRPSSYYFAQHYNYSDPTKAAFANQTTAGFSFYRLSDGNKIILDQFTNYNLHWLYYNHSTLDNNLLTLSSVGTISKIETAAGWQDNTSNSTTPLIWQTHGGIPANDTTIWRTDYPRDTHWQANSRDTYIIYRPNFGSNVQLPADIETEGNWDSNSTGGRSGS